MGTPATIPPPPPGYGPVSMVPSAPPPPSPPPQASAPPPPPPGYGPVSVVPPPTDAPSLWQRAKENIESNLQPQDIDRSTVGGMLHGLADDSVGGISRGFAKGGLQTVGGLLDIYRKLGSDTSPDTKAASDWFKQHSQTDGFWEGVGQGGESLAELLGTEGIGSLVSEGVKGTELGGKALGVADKLKNSQQVASFLQKNDKIAKLAAIGMRVLHAGAQAGAQSYVKSGGDTGQAATGAELGMAGGAAFEGLAAGAKGALGYLARPSVTTEAVGNAAKDTVEGELNRTNAIRGAQPTTAHPDGDYTFEIGGTPTQDRVDGQIAFDPRKKQIGTKVFSGKGPSETKVWPDGATGETRSVEVHSGDPDAPGSHRAPTYQMLPEVKPGSGPVAEDRASGGATLLTKDPELAGRHVEAVNRIINSDDFAEMPPEQQQGLLQQRADLQGQLREYRDQQRATGQVPSKLPTIDVQKAVSATGDLRDAAEQLHNAGREVYDHLNRISGGQWQTDFASLKAATEKLDAISDIPANAAKRADLSAEIGQLKGKLDGLIKDPATGLSDDEVGQAVRNWRTGYLLEEAHRTIKGVYDVAANRPLNSGTYEGIASSRVGERWRAFAKTNPEISNLLGTDRVNTMQRMFDMNDTRQARRNFGRAVYNVAKWTGVIPGGGMAGEMGDHAIRGVIHSLVANPKAAKSLMFAIDSGARPESYAPGIAKMIRTAIPAAASSIAAPGGQQ